MRETLKKDFKKIPKILAKIEEENKEDIDNKTKLNQNKLL
jgi:hypothetical protein